jgi:hypothetical protein
MVDWEPRNHMGVLDYARFKMGRWVEIDKLPQWVPDASNPPEKTDIPQNGAVDAVFTGNSLEYKAVTKRILGGQVGRGVGTALRVEYYARVKP